MGKKRWPPPSSCLSLLLLISHLVFLQSFLPYDKPTFSFVRPGGECRRSRPCTIHPNGSELLHSLHGSSRPSSPTVFTLVQQCFLPAGYRFLIILSLTHQPKLLIFIQILGPTQPCHQQAASEMGAASTKLIAVTSPFLPCLRL